MVNKCTRKRFELSLGLIHELLVLGIAIALFTVCLIISINLQKSTNSTDNIETDWSLNSITDITVSNKGCISPYVHLVEHRWQGTYPGCNCLGISTLKIKVERRNKINRGACEKQENDAGCINIASFESVQLSNQGGTYICAKRDG